MKLWNYGNMKEQSRVDLLTPKCNYVIRKYGNMKIWKNGTMKKDSRADLLTPNWNFSQTDCEASSLLSVKARSAKLWENVEM